MKIELVDIKDLNRINELAVKLHDLHVEWRPDIFEHTDLIFTEDDLKEIITNNQMFVAKIDNLVVGYILFGKIREGKKVGYKYRKQLELDAMIVDENSRHKGIGTKLLNYAIDYAKQQGCTDIRLTVNEENYNARRVYEKIGMKVKNVAYTLKLDK